MKRVLVLVLLVVLSIVLVSCVPKNDINSVAIETGIYVDVIDKVWVHPTSFSTIYAFRFHDGDLVCYAATDGGIYCERKEN